MPYRESEIVHLNSIAATIKQLLADYESASPLYRSYQVSNLKMMCRWLEKFISPRISLGAAEKAKELGIDPETLHSTRWEQQPTRLQDKNREKFHFEHFVPVGSMAKQILSLQDRSIPNIEEILRSAEIAWITKVEDQKLTDNGFRSVRPKPAECCKKAGIGFVGD